MCLFLTDKRRFSGGVLFCVFFIFFALVPLEAGQIAFFEVSEVLVSDKGTGAYGLPVLSVTDKGTALLLVNHRLDSARDSGNVQRVLLLRSTDSGKNWSEPVVIGEKEAMTVWPTGMVVDEITSEIFIFLGVQPLKDAHGDPLHERWSIENPQKAMEIGLGVYVISSKDDGLAWSHMRNITSELLKDPKLLPYGLQAGSAGVQLKYSEYRGRLVVPSRYYTEARFDLNAFDNARNCVFFSDDHGKSWQPGGLSQGYVGESVVTELSDGSVYLNNRNHNPESRGYRSYAVSRDGGESFSRFGIDRELIEPLCHAGLVRYSAPDEGNAILFCNPARKASKQKWGQRHHLTVRCSFDDCKNWPLSRLIDPGWTGYSSIAVCRDGTILCAYERGIEGYRENTAVARFNMAWLKQSEKISKSEQLCQWLVPFDDKNEKKMKIAEQKRLLALNPVVLPMEENLKGVNHHFGWPVGCMSGEALIVVYYRKPCHWSGPAKDNFTSGAAVVRSIDGGVTWSEPVNLESFVRRPVKGIKVGFGNSIGVLSDGTVMLTTSSGLFISDDDGLTWNHAPEALGGGQLDGPRTNNGPRLIEHPDYGIVIAGHDTRRGIFPADTIWLRYSKDRGMTWKERSQQLPEFAKPIEPCIYLDDDFMAILARCHGSFSELTNTWRYSQLVSKTKWFPFTAFLSNIHTSDLCHWEPLEGRSKSHFGGFGPWSQDTADINYNPVSGRIEAVTTNRTGGGEGKERVYSHMTLNLWSIDPEELGNGSGRWRFEGTLLSRTGTYMTNPVFDRMHPDGMHPGAAVIDPEKKVQHIFIYSGYTSGPSGIFCLTRTLETAKLSSWLKAVN